MLYRSQDHLREQHEDEETSVGRSAFRRDYGRLLHSPSFRRLQGKTQLFPSNETDFFRNRLTHSLEVAQIAKGIAQQINATHDAFKQDPLDLDLLEFAGLEHDLGHPPFGHNGEHALDECMKQHGGFEGNAQTLRILARMEKKVVRPQTPNDDDCGIAPDGRDRRLGLNLTYRSLAAILKYDAEIPKRRTRSSSLRKGYYASESRLVGEIKRHVGLPRHGAFKTIECQIMDIADDIAYSTYDLEDAMKGGFAHPLQLWAQVNSPSFFHRLFEKVKREVNDLQPHELYDSLAEIFDLSPRDDALNQYEISKLIAVNGSMRTDFTSTLVGQFMRGVSAKVNGKRLAHAQLVVSRPARIKIESLKHLNFLLTIMSPRLKVVEYRGFEVVKTIFETLNSNEGHLLLPDDIQRMHVRLRTKAERMRLICDFVAGMTDRYAIEFYARLKESGATIFKPL